MAMCYATDFTPPHVYSVTGCIDSLRNASAHVFNELPHYVTSRRCEVYAVVWRLIFSLVHFPSYCSACEV